MHHHPGPLHTTIRMDKNIRRRFEAAENDDQYINRSLEADLFRNLRPDRAALLAYGFKAAEAGNPDAPKPAASADPGEGRTSDFQSAEAGTLVFSCDFMDGQFRADVTVDGNGSLSGRVIDLELQDDYLLIYARVRNSFAAEVRSAYLKILEDIAQNCFIYVPSPGSRDRLAPDTWIQPANPAIFDIISAFKRSTQLNWRLKKTVKKGDIVYIYYAKPWGCIIARCRADGMTDAGATILTLEQTFPRDAITLEDLKTHGIRTVRFLARAPEELAEWLNSQEP